MNERPSASAFFFALSVGAAIAIIIWRSPVTACVTGSPWRVMSAITAPRLTKLACIPSATGRMRPSAGIRSVTAIFPFTTVSVMMSIALAAVRPLPEYALMTEVRAFATTFASPMPMADALAEMLSRSMARWPL